MNEDVDRTEAAELQAHPRVHWHRAELAARPPARIVSLVPSLSEALVLLGMKDRLVGVTEYCVHPANAFDDLPRLGGTKDADVEAIVRVAPDLVIANQEENTARVVRSLADRGIDVWVTYPRRVEEGVVLLEDLARLGPATEEAVERVVTPVRRAFDEASKKRSEATDRGPRVFCPIWRDPWMSANRDTYIHDLIELCGGKNVFAEPIDLVDSGPGRASQRRYPLLDLDQLVERSPAVILLPDEPYAFGAKDVETLASLNLPAARSGRIHLIDGTLVSWYGPRIAESIRVVAGFIAN